MSEFKPNWDVSLDVLAELQKKNVELRARVVRLEEIGTVIFKQTIDESAWDKWYQLERVLNETPQQSLAEIGAAAVEKFIESLWPSDQIYTAQEAGNVGYYKRKANEYTNQLRQQATREN